MALPMMQFGTGRFLQAHVDLFVSEAMERGEALGGILVVQSTASAASSQRTEALAGASGYPVRVRGLQRGTVVDRTVTCHAVREAVHADADWPRLRTAVAGEVQVIVSNTGDDGFALDAHDNPSLIGHAWRAPRSFPAKLLVLLQTRWLTQPQAPLSLFPCELVSRNGDTLREIVCGLATQWALPDTFMQWLREHCVWANSLVDRIVSEALRPVGAVAEPYALWAVERQPGLVLPCQHESIVLTDDLQRFERQKLFILNLGHTWLAESWLALGPQRPDTMTVLQAMTDPHFRSGLESLWADEVLPLFDALGQGDEARCYFAAVRERLLNPFLAHRLADIAQAHAQKKERRLRPVLGLAGELCPELPQSRLRQALRDSP